VAATNKCNINSLVETKVGELRWGVKDNSNDKAILENYMVWLNCPTYKPPICIAPDNCSNPTVVLVCNVVIADIGHTKVGEVHLFTIGGIDDGGSGGGPVVIEGGVFSKEFSKEFE